MPKLHVSKFGHADDRPVIALLHGWGSSSKIWQHSIPQLAESFHIWCVDLPGHGGSQSVMWDESIDQGLMLLANALPPRCLIVGWSLGGLLAQLYAYKHPERVQGMMLIASTPKFIADKDWPHAMQSRTFHRFLKQYDASPQETMKQFIALQVLHGKSLKLVMRHLEQASPGQHADRNLNALRWGLDWLLEVDLREAFKSIQLPIALFHGENDQVSSIKAAEQTSNAYRQVRLCKVFGAGHVPFLSHHDQFIGQVNLLYDHVFKS